MANRDIDEIVRKYGKQIDEQVQTETNVVNDSQDYMAFKREMIPELSSYEKFCQNLGNIVTIKLSQKENDNTQKYIDQAHLEVTPNQALTVSMLSFLITFFVGVLLTLGLYFITNQISGELFLLFFLFVMSSLFLFYYTYTIPQRKANMWRLKASSQMVPAILYIVIYMKHTSNLERAISFASENLQPPLALDFKKIFWNVQTGKYHTVKESLDAYLETWRGYSSEFIESFHLIESSLYEPTNARRIQVLEKSLKVILDGVYDKMLKFTHEVKSPLTNVYMLGIVLPTLALALIPLASTLLQGMIKWYHVFLLFNLIIPFGVYYLTNNVTMNRPGGYGSTQYLEFHPLYWKYKSKKYYWIAALVVSPLIILGLLPFLWQYTPISQWLGLQKDYALTDLGLGIFGSGNFFDFKSVGGGNFVGPFGFGALILSLLIPVGIALFFAISYYGRSKELIVTVEKTKDLEKEFTSSLFQLGNRLADGVPAEIAFGRVAEVSQGLQTQSFFDSVNSNIHKLGMSVDKAIFHKSLGALVFFPSDLIKISMKILVESLKKGLGIASTSLMSISEYMKNIFAINDRLRDLLADIISDMKSNMTFLAPLLAGIVVGLSAMITLILDKLSQMVRQDLGDQMIAGFASVGNLVDIFKVEMMIPPYFLQVAVGIYLIEVIFILTSTLVIVGSGEDKLSKTYYIAQNLMRGIALYAIASLIAIVSLSILAAVSLGGFAG